MGLTVGCARCHDHKFDDFFQEDYYRLQAFMAATHEHNVILADASTQRRWFTCTERVNQRINELKRVLAQADGIRKLRLRSKISGHSAAACHRRCRPSLPFTTSRRNAPRFMFSNAAWRRRRASASKQVSHRPSSPAIFPSDTKSNPRTALARWLSDHKHPLTARVLVNRVLAISLRPGPRRHAQRFRRQRQRARAIRNCSIIWRTSSSGAGCD